MENSTYTKNLLTENTTLKAENAELKRQLSWLMEQVKLNRKERFSQSSEKSEYDFKEPDEQGRCALKLSNGSADNFNTVFSA
jgi:regulator of replication initiation timing